MAAVGILQAMVSQILKQVKVPTDIIVSIYREILNRTAESPQKERLLALLRDLATSWNIYFFVDGLDECDPDVSNEIATGLLSLGPNHRVIFFSRPFPLIHHEAFSDLTFWKIEANRTDMDYYFNRVMGFYEGGWQRRRIKVSPEERLRALDLVEKNSKRSFLLFERQARLIMSEPVRRPLMEYLEEIPESVFERYTETIERLKFHLTPDHPILNTIAWTCVKGSLSITEDVPHIVPRLPPSALQSLNSHVDSSLGLLNIVDGSIQFATKLAQMFVLTKFESSFPTFVSEVRPMLPGFPEGTREWHLKESLELFINTRETLHHNSDGRLGHTAKTDQVSPISPA